MSNYHVHDVERVSLPTTGRPPALPSRLAGSPLRFGYIGRPEPGRGVGMLLDAMPLLERLGLEVDFRFAFSPPIRWDGRSSSKKSVRQHASVQTLDLGYLDDVNQFYNQVDVVILPFTGVSGVDPPLTLLEAMARGKLVITSSVGGHAEVVRHGQNGLILSESSPLGIAKAIRDLLGLSPTKMNEMRRQAWIDSEAWSLSSSVSQLAVACGLVGVSQ